MCTFSSELQNIVYNIAQEDFACGRWSSCIENIQQRISSTDLGAQLVGLGALKELVRAFQYEIEEDKRKVLNNIAANFFGVLEQNMIATIQDMSHSLHYKKLILIAKIFYMCNTLRLLPFLIEPGRLDNWIEFVVAILENQPAEGDQLVQLTTDMATIDQLDKSDYWNLKGICSKISVKLYQK